MPVVLCDSGPLIALARLNRLHLILELWGTVQLTDVVYAEAAVAGQAYGGSGYSGNPTSFRLRRFRRKSWPRIDRSASSIVANTRPWRWR
ncbi:hypothetical protein GPROT1_01015 [Gammaproteobacteria bacterium]|nr:hypothetical protein GPROT1_01015 [Gammaproteobacteria bacterium]